MNVSSNKPDEPSKSDLDGACVHIFPTRDRLGWTWVDLQPKQCTAIAPQITVTQTILHASKIVIRYLSSPGNFCLN